MRPIPGYGEWRRADIGDKTSQRFQYWRAGSSALPRALENVVASLGGQGLANVIPVIVNETM